MTTEIIMPQGGQDITEGIVVKWLKAEGDAVKAGEVICEVETEKAVFEVQSPVDGVLLKIVVPQGQVAAIFSVIGVVGEPAEEIEIDKYRVAGNKEAKVVGLDKIRKPMESIGGQREAKIKVTGRAKKLAAQKGVHLADVQGTGPNGRIREKDVLAYLKQLEAKTEPAAPRPVMPSDLRGKAVAMSKMRKVIARRMLQSKQNIPHFYVTVSVNMTEAIKLREKINLQAGEDGKISINDMVVKAAALALEEFHQVNCTIKDDIILYLKDINIGIAVGLDEGLVVPVLPSVDNLSLKGISKKSQEIIRLATTGKQANLIPGTFTISNMGMLGVENFIAIVNPPETAILAVGTTEKKLIVSEDDNIQIRDMMKMTLSVDHRVIDGITASRFINKIKIHLQCPQTLLA